MSSSNLNSVLKEDIQDQKDKISENKQNLPSNIHKIETTHLLENPNIPKKVDVDSIIYYSNHLDEIKDDEKNTKKPYIVFLNKKIDNYIEKDKKRKLGKSLLLVGGGCAVVCFFYISISVVLENVGIL